MCLKLQGAEVKRLSGSEAQGLFEAKGLEGCKVRSLTGAFGMQ